MNSIPKKILAVVTVATLCACSSAPTRFYTLVKPNTAQNTEVSKVAELQIAVLPVSVPSQVDIPQLLVRQGPGQVALIEDQQWIAPLSEEIRAALAAELAALLGAQDVSGATAHARGKIYRVQLEVRRFESSPGRSAQIEALWTLRAPQKKAPALVCSSSIEEPVGAGYAALVEGHQRVLSKIAAQIADTISRSASASPSCPT